MTGKDGRRFQLSPPSPPLLPEKGLVLSKKAYIAPDGDVSQMEIKIDPHSERLERLAPFEPWDGKDFQNLPILVKTRGKTTTDHISPGGAWLRYRGHLTHISKNLLAGAVNAFTGETGRGTNVMTGEEGVLFSDLAAYYQKHCGGCVIVGDENYGEGSSREHAAIAPMFLGVKAVIAKNFARIHRSNLINFGILPVVFAEEADVGARAVWELSDLLRAFPTNRFDPQQIAELRVDVRLRAKRAVAHIQRVWVDEPYARAGQDVTLNIELKPLGEKPRVQRVRIHMPWELPKAGVIIGAAGGEQALNLRRNLRLFVPEFLMNRMKPVIV